MDFKSEYIKIMTPHIFQNDIYLSNGKNLLQVNILNGKLHSYPIDINSHNGGEIHVNSDYIVIGCFDGFIYVLNKKINEWHRYKHNKAILSKPVIYNNYVYLVDMSGSIMEINIVKHVIRTFVPMSKNSELLTSIAQPIVTEDFIIYNGTLGQLFFIDRKTMSCHHKINLDGKSYENMCFSNLQDGNHVYCTTSNSTYCINITDFSIVWKFPIDSTNAIIKHNNQIVITNGLMVYFLNAQTGLQENQLKFPNTIGSIESNGKALILYDIANKLYVITTGYYVKQFPIQNINYSFLLKYNSEILAVFLNEQGEIHLFNINPE